MDKKHLTNAHICVIIASAHCVLNEVKMTEATLIHDEMSEKIILAAQQIATENGTDTINVRQILKALNISNRVFYNRFRNIQEVLDIIYVRTIETVRKSMISEIDPNRDFFEQVQDIIAGSLIISYESKMNFNSYVFESDSLSIDNYEWWIEKIGDLITYAMNNDLIVEVDKDSLSYGIWCFCRGYNADAVTRGLPRDEALKHFKYVIGFLLDGLRKR